MFGICEKRIKMAEVIEIMYMDSVSIPTFSFFSIHYFSRSFQRVYLAALGCSCSAIVVLSPCYETTEMSKPLPPSAALQLSV
jgi:hypothetical protein